MNKSDLIKYVSDKTKVTEGDLDIIFDVFLNGIEKGLMNGERVKIRNFGSFFIQNRKKRKALDPRNQNIIDVPEKKIVKFKPSKKIVDLINGK